MVATPGLEKPDRACAGETMPETMSITSPPMSTRSAPSELKASVARMAASTASVIKA